MGRNLGTTGIIITHLKVDYSYFLDARYLSSVLKLTNTLVCGFFAMVGFDFTASGGLGGFRPTPTAAMGKLRI